MTILHVLSNANSGGASLACFRLHEALVEYGVDSRLLMLDVPPSSITNAVHFYPYHQAKLDKMSLIERARRKLSFMLGLSHEFYVSRERKKQKRILERKPKRLEVFTFPTSNYDIKIHPDYQKADIIHLHFVAGGFIDYATFFQKCTKPVVWTLHDMNPFTGGCHFAGHCQGYETDCSTCYELDRTGYEDYAARMLQYKRKGLADKELYIISPSSWLRKKAQNSRLLNHCIHQQIPYAINQRIFRYRDKKSAKAQLGLDVNKKHVMFGAYDINNRRKGASLLQKAMEESLFEDGSTELIVFGKGAEHFQLPGYFIHRIGFIKDDEKMAFYFQASDLFIMPSIEDNLPNVVLESIMCGTPVLAFEVGGMVDMIEDNVNGILQKELNANGLKRGIRIFLERIDKWNGEDIALSARKKYGYDTIAASYDDLYQRLTS